MEKTVVKQAVPLHPMGVHGGLDIHTTAHRKPHATAGGHARKKAVAHGEPTLKQASGRTCGS